MRQRRKLLLVPLHFVQLHVQPMPALGYRLLKPFQTLRDQFRSAMRVQAETRLGGTRRVFQDVIDTGLLVEIPDPLVRGDTGSIQVQGEEILVSAGSVASSSQLAGSAGTISLQAPRVTLERGGA